jgi:hypothetical protein
MVFFSRFDRTGYQDGSLANPGGNWNPPRSALDLYTPRFVRGRGAEKVGLCPICIEPPERGGEGKRVWFGTKVSAFKWFVLHFPL